ncbi:MAG: hypothetical protein C0483_19070 [Pirellula sp.]|nr:hypothetical protein [Pirellula sp.]
MRTALLVIAAMCLSSPAHADVMLGTDTHVVFATIEEGKAALSKRDVYLDRLSKLDLAVRLRTSKNMSVDDYVAVARLSVLPWSDEEQARITKILTGMQERSKKYAQALPKRVLLIKTTGDEESGAAYTRDDAVVLPQGRLKSDDAGVEKLIWHELFHVLSRHNPELRDRLYATIGFERFPELALPEDVAERKLTNPDAPYHKHAIQLKVDGEPVWCIPILLSTRGQAEAGDGAPFFQHLELKLLLVERDAKSGALRALADKTGKSRLTALSATPDFFEKIGRNTTYIIHPEEIVADNFALLGIGAPDVESPELLDKIKAVLASPASAR